MLLRITEGMTEGPVRKCLVKPSAWQEAERPSWATMLAPVAPALHLLAGLFVPPHIEWHEAVDYYLDQCSAYIPTPVRIGARGTAATPTVAMPTAPIRNTAPTHTQGLQDAWPTLAAIYNMEHETSPRRIHDTIKLGKIYGPAKFKVTITSFHRPLEAQAPKPQAGLLHRNNLNWLDSGFTRQPCTACRRCEYSDHAVAERTEVKHPRDCAAICMKRLLCEGFCWQQDHKACIFNSVDSRPVPLSSEEGRALAKVDPRYYGQRVAPFRTCYMVRGTTQLIRARKSKWLAGNIWIRDEFCYRIPAPWVPVLGAGVPTKTRLKARFCNKDV